MINVSAIRSLYRELPLAQVTLPYRLQQFVIQLDIAVEVPLLGCAFDIVLNLLSSGVEMAPVGLRIERKCLASSSVSIQRQETGSTT